MLALTRRGRIWNFVDLEPVHPALVRENQQIAVRGRDDQVLQEILRARPHADAALAAAYLPAIAVHRRALQVAAVGHRDRHIFHRHQVFQPDLARVFHDLRAALVAVILLDLFQFLDDQVAQNFLRSQNFQVFINAPLDFGQFFQNLLALHAGQALQLQLDDGLRLPLRELERRNERVAGFLGCARRTDQPNHLVQVLQRFLETEQDVLAVAGLAQFIFGAPPDYLHTVLDEKLQAFDEPQLTRLSVDDRQHDDAEADLQLGVLVEVVQHYLGLLAALQLEHDAHPVAV